MPLTARDLESADEQQLRQWIGMCEDAIARKAVVEVPHKQGCKNIDNSVSEVVMSLHTYTPPGRRSYLEFASQNLATKPSSCLGCEARLQSNIRRMFGLMKEDEWTEAALRVKQVLDKRAADCSYKVTNLSGPPAPNTAIDRLLASSLIEDD